MAHVAMTMEYSFLGMPSCSDIWSIADSTASKLQGIACIEMYLNCKKPINNPFADRAPGSQFLWTLCVEWDKTCRVQVKLWVAQFQLSDLGTDTSGEHLGAYVPDTEQRWSSVTRMCLTGFFFSFWIDLLAHLSIWCYCQFIAVKFWGKLLLSK